MNFEHILFLVFCILIVYFGFFYSIKPLKEENKKTEDEEFMTTTDKIVLGIL